MGIQIKRNGTASLPSMGVEGSKAFLGDVHRSSGPCPMTCGFFEYRESKPLYYEYSYDEMKYIIEGEVTLHEATANQEVHARAGDCLFIPKGSKVTFTTKSRVLAFYCGQRDVPA